MKSVMITGANIGLGKETARQLASDKTIEKVYLVCRNPQKAESAKSDLTRDTGRDIFDILIADTTDLSSVKKMVEGLSEPVDGLLMNAGGMGSKQFLELTKEGVIQQFAVNVLGHVVMLEELIKAGKLKEVGIMVSSEAARGIPKMMIKRPSFETTSTEELKTVIDGSLFKNITDPMISYGWVKYIASLYMGHIARQHPELRLLSVSPGSTSGTDAARNLQPVMKFVFKTIGPALLPMMGMMHGIEKGARRFVDALTNDSYKSGTFYASKANIIVGPLVDQGDIFPDLNNQKYQENAFKAIHSYI